MVTATIEDFASATLDSSMRWASAALNYGYHTGASIGIAMASARAERVTAVAANGLVVLTRLSARSSSATISRR